MDGLTQAIIYDLPYNSNVYSVTVMHSVDAKEKIIMGCTKTDIITLETKIVNDMIETSIVKLNFSNIPINADINSIHCINKSKEFDDFVIGIAYTLLVEDQYSETYLNIYSGFPGSSLEAIMDNCETLKLDFIPFQLTHAIYMCGTLKNYMWLLSGSDRKIHAYKNNEQQICEQNIKECFIEFEDTKNSVILSFGTKSFSDYKTRISFLGCERGLAILKIVNSEKNEILYCFMEYFLSPVTVVQLFNIYSKTIEIENINSVVDDDFVCECDTINEKEEICFLVGSIIDCAVVYMDVLKNDLKIGTILPNSENREIVTSLIADVNFDSKNEIMLGTHANFILNYSYENNEWVERQQLDMRYSIYSISYVDITGEGIKDGVVMSERGIHHLKHEPKNIVKILKNRLRPYED